MVGTTRVGTLAVVSSTWVEARALPLIPGYQQIITSSLDLGVAATIGAKFWVIVEELGTELEWDLDVLSLGSFQGPGIGTGWLNG